MCRRYADQVAVVTGAAQGLGQAMAMRFGSEGAHVVVVDQNLEGCAQTVEMVERAGGSAELAELNVTETAQIAVLVRRVKEQHGSIHVLVNNAGVIRDNRIEHITDEDWDTVLNVNLKGAFKLARAALPVMKAAGYGRILSLSSMSWRGNFGQANYVAAKAGVVGLTRALALEGARHGITSNAIAPGLIKTPMLASMNAPARQKLIAKIPQQHTGEPDDIAEAAAYLCSPAARYVTGVVLDVDGGISIGSSIR